MPYGSNPKHKFDLYVPKVSLPGNAPKPIVIFFHGGGFDRGDKAGIYGEPNKVVTINTLLNAGIAFATADYRLLQVSGENAGIKKCLSDCKDFIDFIRANAATYGLDPNKIALWGDSAGAGLCMLLGFKNGYASGFIKALYLQQPQATYDLEKWETVVYPGTCALTQICSTLNIYSTTDPKIRQIYGDQTLECATFLSVPAITLYRQQVDMLQLMDGADPPFWVENNNTFSPPSCSSDTELNHAREHALTLMNAAAAPLVQLPYHFEISGTVGHALYASTTPATAAIFLIEELL